MLPISRPVALILLWIGLLGGCTMPGRDPLAFHLERVSPRHQAAFRELLLALEERRTLDAETVWARLVQRLEIEAQSGDPALASEVGWQLDAAERFGEILQGRKRCESLEVRLEVVEDDDGLWVELVLASRWPGPLVLRPGSAVLEQESLYLSPQGQHSSRGWTRVLADVGPFELAPLGEVRYRLQPYERAPIGGALALRDGLALRLGSGSIEEGDLRFPAEHWPVPRGLRVNLAGYLPTQIVSVEEWWSHLERPEVGMPSIVERTVRLAPADYDRALLALTPAVQAATPELLDRYRPALIWLCPHRPQPVGLPAWRRHLSERDAEEESLWIR